MKSRLNYMIIFLLIIFIPGINLQAGNTANNAQEEAPAISGKVVELLQTGGYTYVSIEKDGKITWVATPQIELTIGQEISFAPGIVMDNFSSATLNRTFETIVFSHRVVEQIEIKSSNQSFSKEEELNLSHEIEGDNPELLSAVSEGDVKKVKALIASGANPNAKASDGTPALFFAVNGIHKAIVETLLDAGADINSSVTNGMTALMVAIISQNVDVVKLLLNKGADVNVKSKDGVTPLLLAKSTEQEEIFSFIKERLDKNANNEKQMGNIWEAAYDGDTATVKNILRKGINPNSKDKDGWFLLMYAAMGGYSYTVEALVDAGADINMQTNDGATPLMAAVLQGHKEVVKYLIKKDVDVMAKTPDGVTALIIAKQKGLKDIEWLLSHTLSDIVFMDVSLEDLTPDIRRYLNLPDKISGVVVSNIEGGSSGYSGLYPNDVILEVNRKVISDIEDFKEIISKIKADESLLFLIFRHGSTIFVSAR